jgi:transcriptional regulator with XRE-family HTH domain
MGSSQASDSVELALNILKCSQKELAVRLGVSQTQVSKWKNGEYMSFDMENRMRKLMKIGDKHPSFVRWAGSLAEAAKWQDLFQHLAEIASDSAETGYDTYFLTDDIDLLCVQTIGTLSDLGVSPPKGFPIELNPDGSENWWERIYENPYSSLVLKIYKSLTGVYGFYAAYIDSFMNDDDLELWDTPAANIEPCLIDLAATKLDVDEGFAPKFGEFRRTVRKDYTEWLTFLKDKAFRSGIPLRAELLNLVHDTLDGIEQEAESEALGFNSSRLHPDVYMNELLSGMRIIHQVLPAIMKKLGIDDKEFRVDTSELYNDAASLKKESDED